MSAVVTLPAGTGTRTYTVKDPYGHTDTVALRALGARKLPVGRSAHQVKRKHKVTATVYGLAPNEWSRIYYKGHQIASGPASSVGTFTATFKVGKAKGKRRHHRLWPVQRHPSGGDDHQGRPVTPARTRLAGLVAAALAAAAGLVGISSGPASAALCSGSGVNVVVDFNGLGGGVQKGCDPAGAGKSADQVFRSGRRSPLNM